MPLALPNLDDKTYQQLVDEAVALIPSLAPEWTNYNASDPGITLVELFAWFTESLLYRVNRVTPANINAFLLLLNGPDWKPLPGQSLPDQIRDTVLELRTPQRAVTAVDFETLARMADPAVARVRAYPRRNFASDDPAARAANASGYVSVVIVPQADLSVAQPAPSAALLKTVSDYLDRRRLITTVVKVTGPRYVAPDLTASLVLQGDAVPLAVRTSATTALRSLTHPLLGGFDGTGWPFERGLYVSDLYTLLGSVPGVDYVQDPLVIVSDPARMESGSDGVSRVAVYPGELMSVGSITLTLLDANGSHV